MIPLSHSHAKTGHLLEATSGPAPSINAAPGPARGPRFLGSKLATGRRPLEPLTVVCHDSRATPGRRPRLVPSQRVTPTKTPTLRLNSLPSLSGWQLGVVVRGADCGNPVAARLNAHPPKKTHRNLIGNPVAAARRCVVVRVADW